MENILKIDIHAHTVAHPDLVPPHHETHERFLSAEELIGFYDRLGIEKGVLQPIVSPEAQSFIMTSEDSKIDADRYPERLLWFCNVDPRAVRNRPSSNLVYLLEHYKSLGAKGVGEVTANLPVDDPMMENLFEACAAAEMPVLIHISPRVGIGYGIVDDLGLPRLEKMLKKHPKLHIIGHSQPFWSEMSGDNTEEIRNGYPTGPVRNSRLVRLMRECENLSCDISAGSGLNALTRDPEHAASFLTEFADRVYYGCDICASYNTHPFRLNAFLDELRENGAISETVYRKICRENAVRLLGIA